MHATVRLLGTVGVLLVLTAACGDGGGLSSQEELYARGLADTLADSSNGIAVDEDEAHCMASAIIDEVGLGPFEDARVGPDDLGGDAAREILRGGEISERQALSVYEGWEDCADLPAAFARGAAEQFDADAGVVDCLEEGLAEGDDLEQYVVESFTGADPDSPGTAAILKLIAACTTTEDGGDDVVVRSFARSLSESGRVTEAQAQCVAEHLVDSIGAEALLRAQASDSTSASPELQQQVIRALTDAAEACDVPLAQLGGG